MLRPLNMRPAATTDCEIIAKHRHFSGSASRVDLANYALWVSGSIEEGTYLGVLEEREGSVVAGIGLTILNWGPVRGSASPYRGRIVNAFTDEVWRARGIGSSLLKSILEAGRSRGVDAFCLAATPMSRRLYERVGFVTYDEEMRLGSKRTW